MADSAAVVAAADWPLAAIGAGDLVRARRARWRVAAMRRERDVALVTLQPEEIVERADRTLAAPFDRVTRANGGAACARVSRRGAMRRLAALVVATQPFDLPASAAAAPARLLPFQLEPLLALRAGLAARVLIADRVGLGKTIQAALIARDLLATHRRASILILTPAGLRDQWIAELKSRTGLDAWLADADTLRLRGAALPPSVSPWRAGPIVISSIDFVKQPEIRRGVDRLLWDLLIVDEAHTLTRGTDRLAAADAIARRSDRVVLLTATPHDGRDEGFRALCELGRTSRADALAVFRRSRAAAETIPRRVTRRLAVHPSRAERRLHALLEAYAERVWRAGQAAAGARLAMTVLFKRAASSAASLAQSLERRRALVVEATAGATDGEQPALPLEGDADQPPDRVLGAPGLGAARERTWLNLLIHAAHAAARDDAKLRVLRRLLRRVREPVIVFTEYRDTLTRLETALAREVPLAIVHGACAAETRREALRVFERGDARVLLATDAASEGLNLQARCRFVVHVELPWSPTRLEQRVGRVDRLGQTRTVHSLHLVAGRVESAIEARLDARRRQIHAALDAGRDEPTTADETAWLGAAITGEAPSDDRRDRSPSPIRPPGTVWPDLRDDAVGVASRLERLRSLVDRRVRQPRRRPRRRPFTARLRRAHLRHGRLPRGVVHIYLTRITDAAGAIVEHDLLLLAAPAPASTPAMRDALDEEAQQRLADRVADVTAARTRALALVDARRRQAVEHLQGSDARRQISLFPELEPASDSRVDAELEESTAARDAPLTGAAHLVAVLVVD